MSKGLLLVAFLRGMCCILHPLGGNSSSASLSSVSFSKGLSLLCWLETLVPLGLGLGVFPTRYQVDMDLKKAVDEADLVGDKKTDVKKTLKKIFEDKYLNQKSATSEKKAAGSNYFFQKLRF